MFERIKKLGNRIKESLFSPISQYYNEVDPDWIEWANEAVNYNTNQVFLDNLTAIRNYSRSLFYQNSHYFGLVRSYVKYIAGRGVTIEFEDERNQKLWDEFCKKRYFKRLFKEWVRRFFRDGETFLYLPTMKFIDPFLVADGGFNAPYGIGLDENGDVSFYSVLQEKTNRYMQVDARYILHTDATDDDQVRGIPYLLSILLKSKKYDSLLDDRAILNEIRSCIALVRKHAASAASVKTFADAKADETSVKDKYGKYQRRQQIRPGAIIDTNQSTSYEYLSPNINAQDVKDDLRAYRLCFSAATGIPEFITSGDASNSNYASTMVSEGPGEREFEDWQDFFEEEIYEIARWVTGSEECPSIRFRPIINRKTKEETERNKMLYDTGIISKQEWRRRENVDSSKMEEEINGSDETNGTIGDAMLGQSPDGESAPDSTGKQSNQGIPQQNKTDDKNSVDFRK